MHVKHSLIVWGTTNAGRTVYRCVTCDWSYLRHQVKFSGTGQTAHVCLPYRKIRY